MRKRLVVLNLVLTLSGLLLTSFAYAQINHPLQVSLINGEQGPRTLISTSGDTQVLVDANQPWTGPTVVGYSMGGAHVLAAHL